LRELQDNRKRQVKVRLRDAAIQYIQAVRDGSYQEFDPAAFGFEFSIEEIEVRAMEIQPKLFEEYERELAKAS
jgi:hypothetical protein